MNTGAMACNTQLLLLVVSLAAWQDVSAQPVPAQPAPININGSVLAAAGDAVWGPAELDSAVIQLLPGTKVSVPRSECSAPITHRATAPARGSIQRQAARTNAATQARCCTKPQGNSIHAEHVDKDAEKSSLSCSCANCARRSLSPSINQRPVLCPLHADTSLTLRDLIIRSAIVQPPNAGTNSPSTLFSILNSLADFNVSFSGTLTLTNVTLETDNCSSIGQASVSRANAQVRRLLRQPYHSTLRYSASADCSLLCTVRTPGA